MNKRIEELAAQADMSFDKYGLAFANKDHAEDGVDLEKFANLLIQECISICNDATGQHKTAVDCYYAIRERFGIKD